MGGRDGVGRWDGAERRFGWIQCLGEFGLQVSTHRLVNIMSQTHMEIL